MEAAAGAGAWSAAAMRITDIEARRAAAAPAASMDVHAAKLLTDLTQIVPVHTKTAWEVRHRVGCFTA